MVGHVTFRLYWWSLICAPVMTTVHDKLYVPIGKDVELLCPYKSTKHPPLWRGPPDLSLFSDKTKIRSSLQNAKRLAISGRHDIGEFNLKIVNFTANDEGLYRCSSISNEVAVQRDFLLLHYNSPSDIKVIPVSKGGYIETIEGTNITLNCSVKSGNPEEVISWKVNDTTLAVGGPAVLSVTFTADRHDHLKFLTCTAQNSNISNPIELKIQLYVKYIPTVWIEGEHQVKRSEGDCLTITCHYDSGNGNAEVKWIHNNKTDVQGMFNVSERYSYFTFLNLSRTFSGTVQCHVENEIGTESDVVFLEVRYSPVALYNQSIPIVITTERERPANIALVVASFEAPMVLWSHSSGGKLSTWVTQSLSEVDTFIVRSTITPLNHSHFGNYSVRIRNSEGSKEVMFSLAYEELHITAFPSSAVYRTYETIVIKCKLNPKMYLNWTFSLKHYWNGRYIRTLNAELTDKATEMYFSYCDYTDTGQYVCSLHTSEAKFEATSAVLVKGPPIITSKNVSLSNGEVVLSVYAYCFPLSNLSVSWLHDIDGKTKQIDLKALNVTTSIKPSIVTLFSYGISVNVDGMVVEISFLDIPTTKGSYVCQIGNEFGSKEALFQLSNVSLIVKAIRKSHTDTSPKHSTIQIPIFYVFWGVGGSIVVLISMVFIFVLWKRKRQGIAITATIEATTHNAERFSQNLDSFATNRNNAPYDEIIEYEDSSNMGGTNHEINIISEELASERIGDGVNISDYEEIDDTNIYKHEYEENATELSSPDQLNDILEDEDMYLVPVREYFELEDYSEHHERENERSEHDAV